MLHILKERIHQKYRTLDYPHAQPQLSPRFVGRPVLRADNCRGCNICTAVCPTNALKLGEHGPRLDMGLCLFCGACRDICPRKNIHFSGDHRLASLTREGLHIEPTALSPNIDLRTVPPTARESVSVDPKIRALYRNSLRLRQVSAAGCNACEADCNVLTTLVFDLGRFGIDFVASPRHADGLAITGPVSENMRLALLDTYAAIPDPRIVMAIGTCAISGGIFAQQADPKVSPPSEVHNGVTGLLDPDSVHLYVPGCPPSPWTILDAMLLLLGRDATG